MFTRLIYLLRQTIATTFVVALAGLLVFNAYQAYRYLMFVNRVERALVACSYGELLRARDHLYSATRYAPDTEAHNALQSTGRRMRYGDCGENMVGF